MSTHIQHILTVDDLGLMPDDGNRYELIEGDIMVAHAPSLPHQRIQKNLTTLLDNYLALNSYGEIWPTPGVIFDNLNAVIPDLVFVQQSRIGEIAAGEKVNGAPDLAIEIVSPGAENSRRDRNVKLRVYEKFGVSEYWIVDGFQRTIEVYRFAAGGMELAAVLRDQDALTTPLIPGFGCLLRQVFAARPTPI